MYAFNLCRVAERVFKGRSRGKKKRAYITPKFDRPFAPTGTSGWMFPYNVDCATRCGPRMLLYIV